MWEGLIFFYIFLCKPSDEGLAIPGDQMAKHFSKGAGMSEEVCGGRRTGSLNATPLNGSPSFVHMQLSSLRRKKAPNGIKGTFNQEAERSNSG